MNVVRKKLLVQLVALWGLLVAIVVVFETNLLPSGIFLANKESEFHVSMGMELLTICVIPLSLRLFKFGYIHRQFVAQPSLSHRALLRWGTVRLYMLGIPLVLNAVCYYLYMNVAFFYLAVILFLCLFFIYPSKQRCEEETTAV